MRDIWIVLKLGECWWNQSAGEVIKHIDTRRQDSLSFDTNLPKKCENRVLKNAPDTADTAL